MASLVPEYTSSSDSDGDSDVVAPSNVRDNLPATAPIAAESDTSSSEDDSDDLDSPQSEEEQNGNGDTGRERLPNPLAAEKHKLPPPALGETIASTISGSVFVNQFKKAEETKQSVLEKHVKMTNYVAEDDSREKRKKKAKDKRKMCHNYVKGNCKHGTKCRFSHDLNTSSTRQEEAAYNASGGERHADYGNQSWHESSAQDTSQNEDDSYMAEAQKKKRVGVTDSLEPARKAMRMLERQRAKERPWTLYNK